jgi:hypothetical protein
MTIDVSALMYLHCHPCVENGERDDIDVAVGPTGLAVICRNCKRLVVEVTPEKLQGWMGKKPTCAGCEGDGQ